MLTSRDEIGNKRTKEVNRNPLYTLEALKKFANMRRCNLDQFVLRYSSDLKRARQFEVSTTSSTACPVSCYSQTNHEHGIKDKWIAQKGHEPFDVFTKNLILSRRQAMNDARSHFSERKKKYPFLP